jgi:ketosteroid isomerase-like protein
MDNLQIIHDFYEAFARQDAESMVKLYHDNIMFTDDGFGTLDGERAKMMWRMLVERGKGNIKITYKNTKVDGDTGSADWTAEYIFGATGKKVINHIHAEFRFQEGKIIRHIDSFDFWKWSSQALGILGWLLGYTSFLKKSVMRKANETLDQYIEKKKAKS